MQRFENRRALRTLSIWAHPQQLSVENRNILYLTVDTALQGLMMGGIFNFLSVFLVRLGATKLQTSLLTSLPAIVMVMTSIPAGAFVQKHRDLVKLTNIVRYFHRGWLLLVALLPFFVNQGLVDVIIALWTLKALSNVLLESSWMAVVAEAIPPARRASVNGARWTILSVVTAIAGAAFGYLLEVLPFPLNYQIVFIISFVGGSLGMVFWGKMRIPDNLPAVGAERTRIKLKDKIRGYWLSLQVPAFLRYELTVNVLRIGLNLPIALYSVYWIRELNAADLWIGWRSTANQLALIVGYYFWGRVVTRKGHFMPLLICSAGVALTPVLTACIPDQLWLPAVAVIDGLFLTGINLSVFDTLLDVCPSDRRPSFFAVNTMLASLMIFLGPILGSYLADCVGIRGVFFIAAGVHVISALLFWRFRVASDDPACDPDAENG
mgnify:CR=1 FL=1